MREDRDHWLGVDTGGTFTDFLHLAPDGRVRTHKVLSTPHRPEEAILRGVEALGLADTPLHLVHGSTVATNAVLEGKGARTAFVTNRGLRDLLTLARQNREVLYDLQPRPVPPPVPPELCFEAPGRLSAAGERLERVDQDDLDRLHGEIAGSGAEAVAVTLLFSWLDPQVERRVAQALPEGVFVSRSAEVLPRYGEYERGIATWLNAYVGPRMEGDLSRLGAALPRARITVMQSSGERVDAARAARLSVRLLLSGPAAGLVGAGFVGSGAGPLLSFDMGGTSTDVAVIDGAPRLTTEGCIGPYPVGVPMVDMHTIGAGGGSIARLDPGGALQVGPESAGADPGPACYGRGGGEPTVTDAHVVLGRIPAAGVLDEVLERPLRPDLEAARAAVGGLAQAAASDTFAMARGILDVANEHMARALRVMTVERGLDPRAFTLVPFGGAGGLHVCALARELGIRNALVPVHAGVLSALGMLAAPRGRQLTRTVKQVVAAGVEQTLVPAFRELAAEAREALRLEGVADEAMEERWYAEVRYTGQAFSLDLPWSAGEEAAELAERFHRAHEKRYGHRLGRAVEVVNARVEVLGPRPPLELPEVPSAQTPTDKPRSLARVPVHGCPGEVPVVERFSVPQDVPLAGPAVLVDAVSTTWLEADWTARRDRCGNLLLQLDSNTEQHPSGGGTCQ